MIIIINSIILLFVIMLLASLSGFFAERSGVVNIGINGMMIIGALTYWLISKSFANSYKTYYQVLYILISLLSGLIFGVIFGFAVITLKANQIISGTAVNMISAGIGLIFLGKATSSGRKVDGFGWALSTDTSSLKNIVSFSLILGIMIVIISFVAIRYTKWGLRLRSAGENPQALDSKGVSVIKTRYIAILISGSLAGIAGGIFVQKLGVFTANVQGLGFVGIAILISGQWRIPFILISSIIFATIYSFAENIQILNKTLSEIKPLLQTVPFILSLGFLILFSKSSLAPASSGVSYDKSKR